MRVRTELEREKDPQRRRVRVIRVSLQPAGSHSSSHKMQATAATRSDHLSWFGVTCGGTYLASFQHHQRDLEVNSPTPRLSIPPDRDTSHNLSNGCCSCHGRKRTDPSQLDSTSTRNPPATAAEEERQEGGRPRRGAANTTNVLCPPGHLRQHDPPREIHLQYARAIHHPALSVHCAN